jgi:predicted TIM-barrel fold metal-dependent hydrolase
MAARRIDVHFHLIPQFYADMVYAAGSGPAIGRYPDWSPELALEVMDQFEVETALMSLGQPGVQFCKPAEARTLARRCNDYSAELNAKHGKRFGAFGTVSMWTVKDGVDEIGYCLDTLKFAGVSLFASYDGKFLGDAQFDPVMEALNARDGVVFVHPGSHPVNKQIDLPWPYFMMEYLFDTTRAVVNLIFGGALERYPRIRFILPHAGGLVPYFSWRLSVSPMIDKRLKQLSQEQVFALLKRFWYDNALSPGAQTWGCLENVAAPDQIVFGTDWPFANKNVTACGDEDLRGAEAITPAAARGDRPGQCAPAVPAARLEPCLMESTRQTPGRAFTISLGLIALITPLAVHLFFPVIPAVKVALGLSDARAPAHLQHRAVRHGLRHLVLRLAVGSLRPAAGAAVGLALFLFGSVVSLMAETVNALVLGRFGAGDRRRLRADARTRDRA